MNVPAVDPLSMTAKPQTANSTRRLLVVVVRALVLLPVLALRDSDARPTWPAPVELENTAARLAHPVEILPEAGETDATGFSATTFSPPTFSAFPPKKSWLAIPPPAVAPTATTATTTGTSATPAPAPAPATPTAAPPAPQSRPRTLATVRGIAPPVPAPQPDVARLTDAWNRSPQLRDRYLASLLREPPHALATTTSANSRSPNLAPPDASSALASQLSFNPVNVVSAQFRAFTVPADSAPTFRHLDTVRREYNFLGCRLPHSQTELRLGFMDLTDRQFRLNPGSIRSEESRERTAAVSARFQF